MSGLTKQDFIVNSLLGKEIAVYGNPYVFRSLQDELIKFIKLYGKDWKMKMMMKCLN